MLLTPRYDVHDRPLMPLEASLQYPKACRLILQVPVQSQHHSLVFGGLV